MPSKVKVRVALNTDNSGAKDAHSDEESGFDSDDSSASTSMGPSRRIPSLTF